MSLDPPFNLLVRSGHAGMAAGAIGDLVTIKAELAIRPGSEGVAAAPCELRGMGHRYLMAGKALLLRIVTALALDLSRERGFGVVGQ